jgi:hypothetical protein
MAYELWETRTGNLIGSFETESEALDVVRGAIRTHGPAYVDTLLLGYENTRGRSRTIAQGSQLAQLAAAPPGDAAGHQNSTPPVPISGKATSSKSQRTRTPQH